MKVKVVLSYSFLVHGSTTGTRTTKMYHRDEQGGHEGHGGDVDVETAIKNHKGDQWSPPTEGGELTAFLNHKNHRGAVKDYGKDPGDVGDHGGDVVP